MQEGGQHVHGSGVAAFTHGLLAWSPLQQHVSVVSCQTCLWLEVTADTGECRGSEQEGRCWQGVAGENQNMDPV